MVPREGVQAARPRGHWLTAGEAEIGVTSAAFPPRRDPRCLHRGAPFLQQPGGGGQSHEAATDECLSLQERHGDLQLQLFQQHLVHKAEPAGTWGRSLGSQGFCSMGTQEKDDYL